MHRVWRLGQWGTSCNSYLSHPFIGVQTHHYQGEVGMAFDAFIQTDDIAGEALDEQYTN